MARGKTLAADRPYRKAAFEFECQWWADCLARNGGSVSAAAREAGEQRTVVYKILKSLKTGFITRPRHRGNWGDLTD